MVTFNHTTMVVHNIICITYRAANEFRTDFIENRIHFKREEQNLRVSVKHPKEACMT